MYQPYVNFVKTSAIKVATFETPMEELQFILTLSELFKNFKQSETPL
jgi:hypothetical protein